jgi:hypothetical protein
MNRRGLSGAIAFAPTSTIGQDRVMGRSLARTVGRSLAIGAATGGRSFSGIAAVSLSSTRDERPLGNPVAKVLVGLLAVGELVLDKSPKAPNRLEPPGLAGRMFFGGASAGLLARRHSTSPIPQVVVGGCPVPCGISVTVPSGFAMRPPPSWHRNQRV